MQEGTTMLDPPSMVQHREKKRMPHPQSSVWIVTVVQVMGVLIIGRIVNIQGSVVTVMDRMTSQQAVLD